MESLRQRRSSGEESMPLVGFCPAFLTKQSAILSGTSLKARTMVLSISEQEVVRESIGSFSGDIDLGGGVCTSHYQERVLWVERLFAVTVLEHRGALIDELGRYTESVEDGGQGIREAVTTAKWAASAMNIDASSELVVKVWRVARQEPMVQRNGVMVPAPQDMARVPDFVDSAWGAEEREVRDGAELLWSSQWVGEQAEQAERRLEGSRNQRPA
jgi:hypothetical protein